MTPHPLLRIEGELIRLLVLVAVAVVAVMELLPGLLRLASATGT